MIKETVMVVVLVPQCFGLNHFWKRYDDLSQTCVKCGLTIKVEAKK